MHKKYPSRSSEGFIHGSEKSSVRLSVDIPSHIMSLIKNNVIYETESVFSGPFDGCVVDTVFINTVFVNLLTIYKEAAKGGILNYFLGL
jgi:hypothetical protein